MNNCRIFVIHAGETANFPDEFNKPCYEIVDGRQYALNAQLNESSVIKALVDSPPDAGFIGFAQYRRHLVLPDALEADKIYVHAENCLGKSNADDFARFHSALVLRKFIDRVDDQFVRFWLGMYMEQAQAWQRNCFVMSKSRFESSFTPWFNACFIAASSLCDECAKFYRYQQRMPGMLMERAIGAYIWQSRKVVSCDLTTYALSSPWQRSENEMKVYMDGGWRSAASLIKPFK